MPTVLRSQPRESVRTLQHFTAPTGVGLSSFDGLLYTTAFLDVFWCGLFSILYSYLRKHTPTMRYILVNMITFSPLSSWLLIHRNQIFD